MDDLCFPTLFNLSLFGRVNNQFYEELTDMTGVIDVIDWLPYKPDVHVIMYPKSSIEQIRDVSKALDGIAGAGNYTITFIHGGGDERCEAL